MISPVLVAEVIYVCVSVWLGVGLWGYTVGVPLGGPSTAHKSTESGKGRASLICGAVVVSLGLLPIHIPGPSSLHILPGLLLMEGRPGLLRTGTVCAGDLNTKMVLLWASLGSERAPGLHPKFVLFDLSLILLVSELTGDSSGGVARNLRHREYWRGTPTCPEAVRVPTLRTSTVLTQLPLLLR